MLTKTVYKSTQKVIIIKAAAVIKFLIKLEVLTDVFFVTEGHDSC